MNLIFCDSQNKHIVIHHCSECPGRDSLKNYLVGNMLGLEESDLEYSNTEINFSIWIGRDKANLVTESLHIDKFVDLLAITIDDTTVHNYISKSQIRYLMNNTNI